MPSQTEVHFFNTVSLNIEQMPLKVVEGGRDVSRKCATGANGRDAVWEYIGHSDQHILNFSPCPEDVIMQAGSYTVQSG